MSGTMKQRLQKKRHQTDIGARQRPGAPFSQPEPLLATSKSPQQEVWMRTDKKEPQKAMPPNSPAHMPLPTMAVAIAGALYAPLPPPHT